MFLTKSPQLEKTREDNVFIFATVKSGVLRTTYVVTIPGNR